MPFYLRSVLSVTVLIIASSRSIMQAKKDCSKLDEHPLCASNGVTYLNFCEFTTALQTEPYLTLDHRGVCKCSPEEKFDWDPICGTDTDSYANYCEYQKAKTYNPHLEIRHRDLCEEFVKRKVLSYRELQKITKWKKFMPGKLYNDFIKRPVAKP